MDKLEIKNSFEIGKECVRLSFDVSQLEHDRFLVNRKWVSIESIKLFIVNRDISNKKLTNDEFKSELAQILLDFMQIIDK